MSDNLKEREAFAQYLDDCAICEIVPDCGGAFAWAWRAALAQAESLELEADRDSWAQQASDRAGEVVQLAQELEALKRAISEAEPSVWMPRTWAERYVSGVGAVTCNLRPTAGWVPLYTLKGIK